MTARRSPLGLLTGALLAFAALLPSALVPPALAQRAPAAPGTVGRAAPSALEAVFQKARPAAVQIRTAEPEGVGSGFYISADGYVMTAAHVVSSSRRFFVVGLDRTPRPATLVGYDEFRDLAVVKVELDRPVAFLELESATPKAGDDVLTIGNSGDAFLAARPGKVTALERTIAEGFPRGLLSSTMPLAPGDSGGPILNAAGKVVAVAVAIGRDEEGFSSYGAPVFGATALVAELRAGARRGVPFMGVGLADAAQLTPEGAALLRLERPSGIVITSVAEGSGAARAGLRPLQPTVDAGGRITALEGDVIVAADGKALDDSDALRAFLRTRTVGDTVELTVLRGGQQLKVKLTLGTRFVV